MGGLPQLSGCVKLLFLYGDKPMNQKLINRVFEVVPLAFIALVLPMLIWWSGCLAERITPPRNKTGITQIMEVTAYCNCGKCCSWERTLLGLGRPVISAGPNKGKPKQVGITASGKRAQHGTIAADTNVLPFGTIVYVPGYGYGRVEDRGSAIKGQKLDLWFSSHEAALKWGRKRLQVQVWKP